MWWIILLVIVLGAIFLGYLLTRTTVGERRRSAGWNDLHARGQLFTSQLAHLRDVEARSAGPGARPVPRARAATRVRLLWRRHATAPREAGAGGAARDPLTPG